MQRKRGSQCDRELALNYRWEWANWLVQQAESLDVGRDDRWIQQVFEYLCMRAVGQIRRY